MLSRIIKYGAVGTKVRAMWGNRLTSEDYRRMLAMRSVTEIANFLRSHPKWSGALDQSFNEIHRHELEVLLRRHTLKQDIKLFSYIEQADTALVRYPVILTELEQIMKFMRLASQGKANEYHFIQPNYFDRHSKIKYQQLSDATSYEDMLNAVRETEFYPILHRIRKDDDTFPSYFDVELAMHTHFYKSILSLIAKRQADDVQKILKQAFFMQIDMYNITTILRIKRSYPTLQEDIFRYLLPVYGKLKPVFLQTLFVAPDENAVMNILKTTCYGMYFTQNDYKYFEGYSFDILYGFYARHLAIDLPSVFTILAYLYLTDVELKNIVNVIESVRYSIPPEKAIELLIGV